jgi:hypothetical protein
MGLRTSHLELINVGATLTGLASKEGDAYRYKPFKLAELGSQNIKGPLKEKTGYSISKEYFSSLGIDCLSFDITGKQGSIQVDLGAELKEYWGQFEIVANFATSEHVLDEYNCFKNIHQFCKPPGALVHAIPRKNSWPKHCYHYYDHKFFKNLALACGYEILILREVKKDYNTSSYISVEFTGEPHDQVNMQCLMLKPNDRDFISREQFNELRT